VKHKDLANVNVTLDSSESILGDLANREFPCPLCRAGLPILASKRRKPYFICNLCGVQVFVRGKKGISRLSEMVKSGILISSTEQSAMHGINLLNRLESLKLQKQDLEMKTGIIGILFPDENVQNAISLVDAEIKKIEGELANLAHKKEKK
jgi:hypothetical protein